MILDDDILGKGAGKWSKFLLGAIGLPIIYFVVLLLLGSIYGTMAYMGWVSFNVILEMSNPDGPSSPLPLALMFLTIGCFHIFLWLFMRWTYKRKYLSLVNPLHLPWKRQALLGLAFIVFTLLLTEIVAAILPFDHVVVNYVWQIKTWLIWVIPFALIVFLQSSAEEVFFRGFMQQYLARLVRKRWVYMLVPSVYWSLLHIGNFEGVYLQISVVFSLIVMGLIFADWADRTQSLAGPIFAHFGNNFFLTCIYGNNLEPSDLMIWEAQIDAWSDQSLALVTVFGSVVLALVYWGMVRFKVLRNV